MFKYRFPLPSNSLKGRITPPRAWFAILAYRLLSAVDGEFTAQEGKPMKMSVSIAMMLLISTLAISPAFGTINGQPDGTGKGTYGAPNSGDGIPDGSGWVQDDHGAPNSGDGIPDGSGWDSRDYGAPNSGDGIPDGSGWDPDDPGASNSYSLFPFILFVR